MRCILDTLLCNVSSSRMAYVVRTFVSCDILKYIKNVFLVATRCSVNWFSGMEIESQWAATGAHTLYSLFIYNVNLYFLSCYKLDFIIKRVVFYVLWLSAKNVVPIFWKTLIISVSHLVKMKIPSSTSCFQLILLFRFSPFPLNGIMLTIDQNHCCSKQYCCDLIGLLRIIALLS